LSQLFIPCIYHTRSMHIVSSSAHTVYHISAPAFPIHCNIFKRLSTLILFPSELYTMFTIIQ
jgi:hypothetical protein